MSDDARPPDFDWVGISVHFVCGAVLDGLLGFFLWIQAWPTASGQMALLMIGGPALILGLAAALWADRFWEHLPDWLHWW